MESKFTVEEDDIRAAVIKVYEEKYGIDIRSSNLRLHKSWDGSWEISMDINYRLKPKTLDTK